ncbi:2-keto-3-deoxygluconate permease [Cellulomonas aerilata]|uniref:2-keto-3-deoxygluconate permease n=1 Tax=Cellulomonas aerilata TaxID=515326 RepID=A0A512DGD7_9CELL|nr:2-keto-3-deoxygluconate permease [Cellulomonas aerilata]GEO35250.1 2-keto-3-deoxygluconate permease [Cellulomonas aerilata]
MSEHGRSRFPMFATMQRIPGGLMLIPLVLGSLVGTFAPDALGIGSFTTALFKDGALALIALLIFATGTQVTGGTGGAVAGHTLVVLIFKTLIPATVVVLIGQVTGIEGFWTVSILALITCFANSNGGLWLAFAGQYGDERDRGAYIASAFDDGPFLVLLFLGASGLGDIPLLTLLAAVVPFLLGVVVGNVDPEWRRVVEPVPNIVIPFFAFALGAGINIRNVITGGLTGLVIGVGVVLFTGGLLYLAYRFILRRGPKAGIGFAAGTTAGNAVATPAIVAAADPSFEPFVGTATAQVAAAVLVTAILAPVVAAAVLRREGGLAPVPVHVDA